MPKHYIRNKYIQNIAHLQTFAGKEVLEHHTVAALFASCHGNAVLLKGGLNLRVPKDIIGASRFFDPYTATRFVPRGQRAAARIGARDK